MPPRAFLPAILSGLLLWLAFFPLDLGPISAVALVPWLTLVRAEGLTRRRRYFAAYLGGLAFYLPALQWIRVAHPTMYASWFALALYCSCYHVLALAILRSLPRWPLTYTLPVVWVTLEYVRAHFPTGFPFLKPLGLHQLVGFGWYFLGHSLHNITALVQIADVGGVYAISALVAACNGGVFEWLHRLKWFHKLARTEYVYRIGFAREMSQASVVALGLMGFVAYGATRMMHPPFPLGPRVVALQGSVPQDAKTNDAVGLYRTYAALADRADPRADLVVWPETCFPVAYCVAKPGATVEPQFRLDMERTQAELSRYAARFKVNTLLGLSTFEVDGTTEWRYNSALLLDRDGKVGPRYDKMHLVPFGEYVPLKRAFPWLQNFTPYEGDYSCRPGETLTRFSIELGEKPLTFGVLICYEDTEPYLARQYVKPGAPPVDFLVNISNDGWFRGTEEHEQHLAICRFRAIESRRSIVRAVNMGISALIDSEGRVVALPGDSWRESKRMEGTVTDRVPLDPRTSFYAWAGDWIPALGAVLIVLGLLAGRRLR